MRCGHVAAMQIDHFMYAVSSLDEGDAWAASVFDAEPAAGGAHVGLGTRNALLSLGHTYLELIAPDPEQDIAGTQGERFAALAAPGLVTWAARGDLGAAAQTLQAEGIRASGPHRTQRATPGGGLLIWDLLFHGSEELGGLLPFCIDWLECPHPSGVNPVGGQLEGVTLALQDPAPQCAHRTWRRRRRGLRRRAVDVGRGGLCQRAGDAHDDGRDPCRTFRPLNPFLARLGYADTDRVVITHADDMGFCHAATAECLQSDATSCASVLVNAPWFPEAERLCRDNPGFDVGVHLTLTSEYDGIRWSALSATDRATGMLDDEGYLWRTVAEAVANVPPEAAKAEMRAQIDRALAAGIDVTHIDTHMGTVVHPRYLLDYLDLAREYAVPA
ncbi:MAG: hypothetical protein CMQ24_04925, partial [Gammaproteobacteria bacterium]|nr:hypothetical protein [Gammaproteobacteria bacterium]